MTIDLNPDTPVEIAKRKRRRVFWLLILLVLYSVGLYFWFWLGVSVPDRYPDDVEMHFKYGSIGSDNTENGLPARLIAVLPKLFPDKLPRPLEAGERGLEPFGFLYEKGMDRPIGFSRRRVRGVELLGLNCAACHTGTYRTSAQAPRRIVLGMPAHQLDLQGFFLFLFDCAADHRFTTEMILDAMDKEQPLGPADRLLFKFVVIPRFKENVLAKKAKLGYWNNLERNGPGRIDTFGPYAVLIHGIPASKFPGCADFPALWNQEPRDGMLLHWDGNNPSLFERNLSASIGAGCTPETVDLNAIDRIRNWTRFVRPADRFPLEHVDVKLARNRGRTLYMQRCSHCHDFGAEDVGKVTPQTAVGTDPDRMKSFFPELVDKMNTIGEGYSWKFRHFRRSNGYANMPLDDLWLKAPYFHNGSVPTLWDVLLPPERRVKTFPRGWDVYDFKNVGFSQIVPDDQRHRVWQFDTTKAGNSNAGHDYTKNLTDEDRRAILEYLKYRDATGNPR